ncbi:MAG TPA: zinc-dependent metalloprotease family protein [Ideonella sp.]|uniref:reprolysin-like metallopeptidase n=1 Tax=Ideonella sp. TaxID=1929293 RepID=UPI002B87CC51|nr:zinc-dependent metalloprotease family protein [Ideonella sp.]HSI52074.1 zinc-dependent metalloprotease family protein [Ideonella sp.]
MLFAAVWRAVLVLGISSSALGASTAIAAPLWRDVPPAQAAQALSAQSALAAPKARWVQWDSASLQALVERVPAGTGAEALRPLLDLPMPDGSTLTLRLSPVDVMAPGLATRYPQIHSLVGTAVDQPGVTARIDFSPHGFKAMVFTPQGRVFIDPGRDANAGLHQVYLRQDLPLRHRDADRVLTVPGSEASPQLKSALAGVPIGTELLTYRLALATTGEYAKFQDPDASPTNKAGVLAELVSLTNRVTGVYERELGIRLQLIEGEDAIIYTDAGTDPYANSNGSSMLGQNIRTLRTVLGNDAFDVGHVVSTGGGGVAYLGVICGSNKAGGVTGLGKPVGDGFYIDYVAHEMGHQFGANHTFNSVTGSCGGGNRAASAAYEPGSGTTIMGYAGICGADDIQPHSDAQFHSASYDEIVAYTRSGNGASCAAVTASGNTPPTATVPAGGFTIPANTPFELTGKGKDADGKKTLSYQWEERDLGPGGSPDAPTGTAPLFRAFPPVASTTRTFPQLSDLLGNTHTLGELLPTETRPLNFRFIVRDNQAAPSAGGLASADLSFNVTADAGPFKVTAPNTNVQATAGGTLKVKWDVAKTDVAPVSCATVEIWLSTDGGQTMAYSLKSKAANTGSAKVTLPAVSTSQARIKVKCHGNVFFDISDVDFRIGG